MRTPSRGGRRNGTADRGARGVADTIPEGNIVTGPYTAAAMLRGQTKASLRNKLAELKGTGWGHIAECLAGANGNGADRLDAAMKGLRFAGMTEPETRRYIIGKLVQADPYVEEWLDLDPVMERRKKLPLKNAKEVEGMFEATGWIWNDWIPRGYLSMIVGKPGAGKSYI